jgi:hypothetical protein
MKSPVGWFSSPSLPSHCACRSGTFGMYAGYINVGKTNNRNLYYWFVESQGNPATDPVILWLNGGG